VKTKSVSLGGHDRRHSLSCAHGLLRSPSRVLLEVVPIQTPHGFFCPFCGSFCCLIWVCSLPFSGLIRHWCGSFCCRVEPSSGSWICGGVSFCSFYWLGGFVSWLDRRASGCYSNGFLGSWPSTAVICVRFGQVCSSLPDLQLRY
jgi:hypothetical protein